MAHKLADLRAKHKAFKEEADAIFAAAETAGAELTDVQDQRLVTIKGEVTKLESEIDAEIAALETTDKPNSAADVEAERKRAGDILAACKMVGKTERAAAFITEGKSLAEVVGVLQSERATESDKNPTDPGNPARHGKAEASWDKAVAKHNQRNGFK
ncbi:hypothetical protein [Sinorhizobium americanum]|uniref:Uncharacterized protein n=1 Tax=Sinorhizobium americanum TaxID=194963 RepID=A0A4V2REX0_9HYPH|nr:hypothetical protein [Sinorhizobium americanum]TCN30330.1 hypothetical protein EV184_108204 [Sinorhizobium americanum]